MLAIIIHYLTYYLYIHFNSKIVRSCKLHFLLSLFLNKSKFHRLAYYYNLFLFFILFKTFKQIAHTNIVDYYNNVQVTIVG